MILKHGSSGKAVELLQQQLGLKSSGYYGPDTITAVRAFQSKVGLESDGIAGPNTLAAISAPWLPVALKELGEKEIPGHHSNPRIIEYFNATQIRSSQDETPWCAAFVNWCLREAGIKGTDSALAASFVKWGVECERKPGAIIVLYSESSKSHHSGLTRTGYHVAFFHSEDSLTIRLLGGNQGDQVKYSNFSKIAWKVAAVRWPE